MKDYLLKRQFDKLLPKLYKKLRNKKILVYGTGKMFQHIAANYNLKPLNIIGVTDIKYLPEDLGKEDCGFKIIPYAMANDADYDVVLVAVQNYPPLFNFLKMMFLNKPLIPLVPVDFAYKLKRLFRKLPCRKWFKRGNVVVLVKSNGKRIYSPKIKNLEIKFSGKNNYVEIHEPFRISKSFEIYGGSENKIVIGAFNRYTDVTLYMGSQNSLEVGKNTTIVGAKMHYGTEHDRLISIGDDCQFSWDILIRTSDTHTVYDINTKEVLNPAKDVFVGNHVWVTRGASLLKGAHIPSNSVVGTQSVVNKQFFEENCVIAGVPAKVTKRGINWDRRGIEAFEAAYASPPPTISTHPSPPSKGRERKNHLTPAILSP